MVQGNIALVGWRCIFSTHTVTQQLIQTRASVTTALPTFANTIKAIKNNVVKCFTILVKQLWGHLCVCVCVCLYIIIALMVTKCGFMLWGGNVSFGKMIYIRWMKKEWRSLNYANDICFITVLGWTCSLDGERRNWCKILVKKCLGK